MDVRISILCLVCLLNSCLSVPLQVVFNKLETVVSQSTEPESLDVFQIITKENEGSSQLMHEGDIAIAPGRSAMKCADNSCFWPKSSSGKVTVPYTLSSDYSSAEVQLITNAMQDFSRLTCIQFVARTTEADYLQIQAIDGCWSYMGKNGGAQKVSLTPGCFSKGTIQHELNHALGFYHEQSRSDRDNYVTILTENISPANVNNFKKEVTNNLGLEYDYTSVMHYGKFAFSSKGQPTIIPKSDPSAPIGQRNGLSNLDISKINTLYQCGTCSTLLTSPTGSLSSTNNPSSYPNNANCVYLIQGPNQEIHLRFDAFDLQSSPGCGSDYIKVYDGATKASPVLLDKTCGTGQRPPLVSSGNAMLIEFVSDGSITASGFKASYSNGMTVSQTVNPVNPAICGGTFTSSPGTFSSPNYPDMYRSNMDCSYIITAPVGYLVLLRSMDITIKASVNCNEDYISIFDGARSTSRLMGKHCGTNTVPAMISTGNSMLLQFHSDESLNMKGFQANYLFVRS